MFRVAFQNDPRLAAWQARMARVPRWGWWLIGVAVITPIVLIFAGIIILAVIFGFAALAVVVGIMVLATLLGAIRVAWWRLRNRPHDDGRRNVKIVVRRPEDGGNW